MRQGQVTPDPYGGEGGGQEAYEAPGNEEGKKWGNILRRHGRQAPSAQVGKQLSWGKRFSGLIPSNLPKGAGLSPAGDLGLLRGIETEKVFKPFRNIGASVVSSKEIPLKKEFVK